MDYNRHRYIIAAATSILFSTEMTIGYGINHNWILCAIHLVITCCIIYICLITKSLMTEIYNINKLKPPTENIPINYNPILENELVEV